MSSLALLFFYLKLKEQDLKSLENITGNNSSPAVGIGRGFRKGFAPPLLTLFHVLPPKQSYSNL